MLRLWSGFGDRSQRPEQSWISDLASFLKDLVTQRVAHVQAWIDSNTAQLSSRDRSIEELRRKLESEIVQLERGVELCALQCKTCKLLCIKTRFHASDHDCRTNHRCIHFCQFVDKHTNGAEECDLTSVTFTLDKQSELIVDSGQAMKARMCTRYCLSSRPRC